MASKLSVAFAQVLIRAELARRILVMAITPSSSGVTRCLHHILVFAIIEATPDTVGDRIWRNRGRGLAELPGGPLLVP